MFAKDSGHTGAMSSEARQRLAQAVTQRRQQLGLSQAEVRGRGGPSAQTMTNIERAKGAAPHGSTLQTLDHALEWEAGTAAGLLAEPQPSSVTGAAPVTEVIRQATDKELLDEVGRRMQGGQQWATGDASPEDTERRERLGPDPTQVTVAQPIRSGEDSQRRDVR